MTIRIDTINRALLEIGEPALQSELSPEAQIAVTAYEDALDTLIGLHPWSFARAYTQLSDVSADRAPRRRARAFAVPGDRVGGSLALYEDADATVPVTDWELLDGRIESDAEALWLRYVVRPDELLWPPLFRQCLILLLASKLALRIQERPDKAQALYFMVMGGPGDPGDLGLCGRAQSVDAQGQPSEPVMSGPGPLMRARWTTGRRRW